MALSTVAKAVKPKTYDELQAKVFRCLANEEILLIYIQIEEIGASVIHRGVAEAIQSNGKQSFKFDKTIQLRAKQSQREIQREIALALKLDSSIMAMFDEYDEKDDFTGVLARDPIPPVANEIHRNLKDSRFLLIIYDYSVNLSIDLAALGVPFAKWSGQKILWIAEYSYVMASRKLRTVMEPDVFLSMAPADSATALDRAYKEASEIAYNVNKRCGKSILTPPVIFRCMWYQTVVAYFSEKHNIQHVKYCMCEGIIEEDAARVTQNMLPQNVLAKITRKPINSLIWDALMLDSNRRWIRPELLPPKTIVVLESSLMYALPPDAENYHSLLVKIDSFYNWDELQWGGSLYNIISSVFMRCRAEARLATPDNFFRQFTNLRVLHLFRCIISSMPHSFLGLHNLRFLRLESRALEENKNVLDELQRPMNIRSPTIVEEGEGQRLGSLLILDLFDNNFGSLTSEALELMPNLEEINMVKSTSHINLEAPQVLTNLQKLELIEAGLENVHDGFFEGMKKLQVLNLSGNRRTKCVPKSLSMATSLKELILDECEDLEIPKPNLPTSLELISLQGCASLTKGEFLLPPLPNLKTFRHTLSKLTMLSLQGCTRLEDINLNQLHELEVLNLSRTALKYLPLDITKTPKLKQLILLGCEKLKRITWDGLRPPLVGLFIDNCSSSREDRCCKSFQTRKEQHIAEDGDNIRFFEAHIVVRDARFLHSLVRAFSNLQEVNIHIHIHISSSAASSINSSGTRMISSSKKESESCHCAYYYPMIKGHAQNELPSPSPPLDGHIEVDGDSGFPTEIKEFMRLAKSLYLHNNASVVTINHPMRYLKQCWVERCYNMDTIFTPTTEENDNALELLEIIRAYNLLRLNAVCKEGINLGRESFSRLRRIYLEFCPRLKFIFPSNLEFSNLESINIRNCSDLREVFFDQREDGSGRSPKSFPMLSSICLQELPKLQYICKSNISCPVLKELKFRGCWSLRKFPLLDPSDHAQAKALKITCEKDWWEKLEWDGLEANKFNPSHSSYYRKPLKSRYLS